MATTCTHTMTHAHMHAHMYTCTQTHNTHTLRRYLLFRTGSETTGTLYEVFIESLQAHLGSHHTTHSETTGGTTEPVVRTADPVFADNVLRQLQVKGVRDPLLAENFSQLITGSRSTDLTSRGDEEEVNRCVVQGLLSILKGAYSVY